MTGKAMISAVILPICAVFFVLASMPVARADLREDCDARIGDDTIKACTAFIKKNPGDAAAYYSRGRAYWKDDDEKGAVRDFSKAIELAPQKIEYYLMRATVYLGNHDYRASGYLENFDRALADATRAIAIDPNNAQAYGTRCRIYVALLDRQRATDDCKRALELDPEESTAKTYAEMARSVPDQDALAGPQQPVACSYVNDRASSINAIVTNTLTRELPPDTVVKITLTFERPSKLSSPSRVETLTTSTAVKPGQTLARWPSNLPTTITNCTAVAIVRSEKSAAAFLAELMKPNPLGEISIGSDNAPVTIIQYARLGHGSVLFLQRELPYLKQNYIDTGKVRYFLRERAVDPKDIAGFMFARCASKGDRAAYLSLITKLMDDAGRWPPEKTFLEPLKAFASKVGVDEQALNACLSNKDIFDRLGLLELQSTEKLGLRSQGVFFINGTRYTDDYGSAFTAREPEKLKMLVDGYLEKSSAR